MNARAAPEGAGRFDHTHGDESTIDLAPHLARALDDVVEPSCPTAAGPRRSFPASTRSPRAASNSTSGNGSTSTSTRRKWPNCNISLITDFSLEHDTRRHAETSRVEAMLREELTGSAIVRERAEKLAEEAREA